MFRIAGCRQPAIRAGASRLVPCRTSLAPLASKHHHAAHMRRSQPRPCLGRGSRAPGCFRAENEFRWLVLPNSCAACASFANAGNKTPPGLATRGRSRCLGRSGWPISHGVRPLSGVAVPVAFANQAIAVLRAGARIRAAADWPQCKQERVDEVRFHWKILCRKNAAGAKAAHDTRVFRHAQQFFNNEIAIPTNGSDAAVDATQ